MKISSKLIALAFIAATATGCLTPEESAVSPTTSASSSTTGTNGQGGSQARFTVVGNTMYFVDNSNLKVMSLANSENPELVHTVELPNDDIETIYSHETYLYIGSSTGMYIYDIATRNEPEFLSHSSHVSGCDPVVSDGEYAYVTVRNSVECNQLVDYNALEIFEVSDPTNPVRVHTQFMDEPAGLAIDGNTLFICDDELEIYDVTSKTNPVLIASYESDAVDIIIDGDNVLTVTPNGIVQYAFDRENQRLTFSSSTISN